MTINDYPGLSCSLYSIVIRFDFIQLQYKPMDGHHGKHSMNSLTVKIYVDVDGELLPLPQGHPKGSELLPHGLHLLLQLPVLGPELCVLLILDLK